jgi:hypothetical protein
MTFDKPTLAPTALLAICLITPALSQIEFEVTYLDPAGVGFFDQSTPQINAPGNSGTTLGEQRRIAFEAALASWTPALASSVPIRISAEFLDFGCSGFAGTGAWTASVRDAPNAFFAGTWEQVNMANARAGFRLPASVNNDFDARVRMNLVYDDPDSGCTPLRNFYYGVDGQTPPPAGLLSFLALAVHEVGHTLGFGVLTNLETGQFSGGFPDSWAHFLMDSGSGLRWVEMNDGERAGSAISVDQLVWSGDYVIDALEPTLIRPPQLQLDQPVSGETLFAANIHGFGPYQSQDGITGDLVKADPLLACTPISNDVSGSVVLIQRGSCPFSDKQDNAAAAGALAIVMVDSLEPDHQNAIVNNAQVGGLAFPGIPFWTVTRPDGQPLLDAVSLPQVTLRFDPDGELLGTQDGLARLYAPADLTPGSSVVHFDTSLFPHAVMRPFIPAIRFAGGLDMSPELLWDIGWPRVDSLFHDRFQFAGGLMTE